MQQHYRIWYDGYHRRTLFFFQAEDGIRDRNVTGVQTCALPISPSIPATKSPPRAPRSWHRPPARPWSEIGRASCRERVSISGGAVSWKRKTHEMSDTRYTSASRSKMNPDDGTFMAVLDVSESV